MTAYDIIYKKRFGGELTEAEIRFFVRGVVDGTFADYQASALLMAICINGMTDRETLSLTMEMAHSGAMLDLGDVPGIKADKHSTGGVGDTTSLVLVPLVAACGVKMSKMSGRGLGFTGGTLDKMESIPGMRVSMDTDTFKKQITQTGCAIIGQTEDLAPADKVLYALRDVTATVDCLPLVISSILSKKLAGGADIVLLDVKMGSGAVMKDEARSRELAEAMVRIGKMSGRRFAAMQTDMSQPLGNYIGNALEVEEAIDILAGRTEGDLKAVSLALGGRILYMADVAESPEAGATMLQARIDDGSGLKKLAEMIEAQGGDPRVAYDTSLLPKAEKRIDVRAEESGFIASIQADRVGYAAQALGAGRVHKTDVPDPAVGVVLKKRLGDAVRKGDVLCTMHVNPASDKTAAYNMLRDAIRIGAEKPALPPLIHAVID